MLKKRALVLTPRFPYPMYGGDRMRILHVCRALSREFSLTLLSLCESREEMRLEPQDGLFAEIQRVLLPRWRSYLNSALALPGARPLQLAYYDSAEFRRKAETLAGEHDLVLAHLIRTGQYIEHMHTPRVLEMTDAISMNYERVRKTDGMRGWKRWVYALEEKRLHRYERNTIQRFDRVWLTSSKDREYLDMRRDSPLEVIPNGTDLEVLPYTPPVEDGNAIVFIGNMTTLQNEDACEHFAKEILPGVRAEAPDAVLRIVGNAPPAMMRKFAQYDGVELTGRVAHIRDGVRGGFCGVCPVRAAAGIQNKVLEYMALGLPCVTSQLGLGGVEARNGIEVLVYQNPAEAVRQILELHRHKQLRLRLAEAGRALVEQQYDWKSIYPRFTASCLVAMNPAGAVKIAA